MDTGNNAQASLLRVQLAIWSGSTDHDSSQLNSKQSHAGFHHDEHDRMKFSPLMPKYFSSEVVIPLTEH